MMEMSLRNRFDASPWLTPLAALALGAAATLLAVAAVDKWRREPAGVSDDILKQRVRARVGELVSRPDAIQVDVEGGVVRLSGEVMPQERDGLLAALIAVPGVWRVRNALGMLQESA
jgi:osmotically-inducible protein OsmY